MAEKIFIHAGREGYSVEQTLGETMTVGELIDYLRHFDDDTQIYIEQDDFYTFASLCESDFLDEDGNAAW